jgi:hypothetical protein
MMTNQEKMIATMIAGHEEMMAMLGDHHGRTMARLGKMKNKDVKTTGEEMESETEHREATKEGVVVKPVDGRKKRNRGRNLAVGRRGKPKDLTRDPGGSWLPPAGRCPAVQ